MKQLMVISHDTYAQGLTVTVDDIDSIASLAVGAYAIVDKDPASATYNHILDLAAANEVDTPKYFQFVTMTANGLKWSPIIKKTDCKSRYQATVAAVAKTMLIAGALANPQVGEVAGFIVTDLTKPAHVGSRNRSYAYTVQSGDVKATIVAALIALVNADSKKCVTASANGADILLTGDTAGAAFQVSMLGILRGATITNPQALVVGTGLGAQVRAFEKECEVEQGAVNYPTEGNLFFTKTSEVVLASAYNCYYITFTTPTQRPLLEGQNPEQLLVIALLSTLTASGNADVSMEAMLNWDADINA